MSMAARFPPGPSARQTAVVSPQPEMAVSGVRAPWETDETNSDCIFSVWLILTDILLMVSGQLSDFVVNLPLNLNAGVGARRDALGRRCNFRDWVQNRSDEEVAAEQDK